MKKVITTVSAMTLTIPAGADSANASETIEPLSQDDIKVLYADENMFKGSGFIDLDVQKTVYLINDADNSGTVTLGDQLQYTIQVTNLNTEAVSDVALLDFLESKIELNLGTVAVTQGFVITGNNFNDPSDVVFLEFGTIAPEWFALVNFTVDVVDLEPGINIISNSAEVFGPSGSFFVSDDPTTPEFDPTRIEAIGAQQDIIFENGFDFRASGGF